MANILTFGEPMALLMAEKYGPLKDVPLFRRRVSGAEVNIAIGLTRLGHSVSYISRVGQDPFGAHILDFLTEQQINTRYIEVDTADRTGIQLKEKPIDGQDPIVVNFRKGTAFSHISLDVIHTIDWQSINHLHVTGIPAGVSEKARRALNLLMDTARARQIPISFDPNLRPSLWKSKEEMVHIINEFAAKANIVLPGIGEGNILTGHDDAETIADTYLARGVDTVIVKLGGIGAFTKCSDGNSFHTPGFPVKEVIDTVGAGDGFAVGVLSALLEGRSLADAVQRGTAIGARSVMTAGDNEGLPTSQQLEAFLLQEGK